MSESAKKIAYWISITLVTLTSVLIVAFFIALRDYSYAGIAAPVSVIGVIAWCFAGLLRWRHWLLFPLFIFALPFLPWVEIVYG